MGGTSPVGQPTRGTTGTNRLRRNDRWIAASEAFRRASDPLVVDLGYGASGVTAFELATRLRRARADAEVLGLEIDPQRVATARAQLDDVRRDFIANISHELKTPIASVGLLAEALEEAADEPEQVRRFADRLGVEATRLGHITSDVIELSRLQARDALRRDELLDVDRIVAAAVDQNRVVAASKGVEVRVRVRPERHSGRRRQPALSTSGSWEAPPSSRVADRCGRVESPRR